MSREEIERDVTQELESFARSGSNPPPPEWTLLGGMPEADPQPAAVLPEPPESAPTRKKAPPRKRG